jgi:dihydroorotate dehydrogenase
MYELMRRLLFMLPSETAHDVGLAGLSVLTKVKKPVAIDPKAACTVMGIRFPNRIGLAAGLDKNGDHIHTLSRLGFGFLELGTVTPQPQIGNPKPRLFRLSKEQALINRMGFNNKGIAYLLARLEALKTQHIIGINIGKGYATPIPSAVNDYLYGLEQAYPWANYLTINISSPNTPDLRQMQTPELLIGLLKQLKERQAQLAEKYDRIVPLAVKIAPDLSVPELEEMASIFLEAKVDAVIATNTTIERYGVLDNPLCQQAGGLSGAPLFLSSLDIVRLLHRRFGDKIPIIACGGIMSYEDGAAKLAAGAQLLQVYTGFIYKGPGLIRQLASL